MEFVRFKNTRIYFSEGKNFFVFWKNNNDSNKLIFSSNFINSNSNNWLLIFHEENIDKDKLKENKLLRAIDDLADHNSAILWVEDFESNDEFLGNSRRLILDNNIVSTGVLAFNQNNQLKEFRFGFGGIDGGVINITETNNLILSRSDNKDFEFKINVSNSNFKNLIIGLLNETGCASFTSTFQDEKSSLNIAIPYYETTEPKIEPVVVANIFDRKHLVGCILNAKYYPYSKSNNSNFRITHPNTGEQIKTNILDFDSNNLHTDEIANIEFSFSKIVHEEKYPVYNRYILSPSGGQIKTSSPHALLGNSGTESIETNIIAGFSSDNNLNIKFSKTQFFKVPNEKIQTTDFAEEGLLRLEKHNDLSEAGCWTFVKKAKYNNDAQESPLFSNLGKTVVEKSLETEYFPIKMANLIEEVAFLDEVIPPLPIIPTLAFAGNPRLIKLENVFSKIRLRELTKNPPIPAEGFLEPEPDKKYVTPQGFLRTPSVKLKGSKIDFIKSEVTHNKEKKVQNLQFSIDGVTVNSDFNLSLSKEDVFFVLTPSMLKERPEKISVTFKIRDFTIDLTEFNELQKDSKIVKNDTYIIFKFSRQKFSDLLEDPSKWSNYGHFKDEATNELKNLILAKVDFPNVPGNEYTHFNEKIKNNKNWNGVIILNIPIGKGENLPSIFNGLSGSQDLNESSEVSDGSGKLNLKTGLKFQYVAFPVNRTKINGGEISISSSSFYGLIDYDLLNKAGGDLLSDDYTAVSKFFPKYRKSEAPNNTEPKDEIITYKFLLTKLLVRFENSLIVNFKSNAFLQIPDLFDNKVEFDNSSLSHPDRRERDLKPNLIRLDGHRQKNGGENDEFNFSVQPNLIIKFKDNNLLTSISVSKLSFTYSEGTKEFRFDIDAGAGIKDWSLSEYISIEKLEFQNIGFKFNLDEIKLPSLQFDTSKLLVFPEINFNGNGFLSSFPIKFSHFQGFKIPKLLDGTGLGKPNFDFYSLKFDPPKVDADWLSKNTFAQLFSFIFDFDLGTFGDLGGLKALKGQLLVGWSFKGGFALGFKLAGPSSDGLHLDLFGAVKLDVKEVSYGKFKPKGLTECSAYFLRLNDARITIFGEQFPGNKNTFNGIIITDFSNAQKKIAWLINYDNQETGDLILGIGQRMGPPFEEVSSTVTAIQKTKDTFVLPLKDINGCTNPDFYNKINFRPERNWLFASEAILPKDWPIELKFIFNDPVLYGIYLGFKGDLLKGFSIDILYKKLSESLGVYSTEIQLPDSLRNQELGGAFLKLPNIGIEVYTNGDWKVDIGFPRNGNDWSRSGFLQLRTAPPFVGFFGFYIMMSKVASLTLFKGYIDDTYSQEKLQIIQAGFAMRVGIGFYFDKGILYLGASITVYGILEGAFAFERQKGLAQLFPDHFAVLGRMGAIAELVGYVDFGIIKASVYISLRAEFGMLMVYIGNSHTLKANGNGSYLNQGIQPVLVFIEGEVIVRVSIKIGCVKIRLSFRKLIRFEYMIGGGNSSSSSLMGFTPLALPAFTDVVAENEPPIPIEIKGIKEIPMMYLPAFSKVYEGNDLELKLIHSFMIPFFGKNVEKNEKGEVVKIIPSDKNIIKDKIIKPFFKDLIDQLETKGVLEHNKYETIRSVLVTGYAYINKEDPITKDVRKTKVKIDVSISGYVPTFITGINSGTEEVVNEILKKQFLFHEDSDPGKNELKPKHTTDNSIEGKYRDELLLIPAPISSNIKIVDSNKIDASGNFKEILNALGGFDLNIKGLVDREINSPIVPIEKDVATLVFIEKFYDDYKTQFLDRSKTKNAALFAEETKDIRETVIIPEFFKLIGLLTIETFQNETNPKNKDEGEWNPEVYLDANGDFINSPKENKKIFITNNSIPQIVGQLNYFYNSGLRLPFEDENYKTKSIYSILQQEVTVKPIAVTDLSKIKIDFNGVDLIPDVFRDDSAKRLMLNFISDFNGFDVNELKQKLITKDDDYNPTDNPIQFSKPYKLTPVSLAVPNGKLGIESEFRFFEIPRKLSQHSVGKTRYSFEVNYAKYEKDTIEYSTDITKIKNAKKLDDLYKGLNVEIKVKKHNEYVLEIVNVFADDLNLMNALHSDDFSIGNIDFYYKPDADPNNQEAVISLINLKNFFVTILKTNLSPRTSPPIFKEASTQFVETAKIDYWADSNEDDTTNFIRLVWEALTTNNGGYYLILDKKFENKITEGSIIISFASKDLTDNSTPAYFNVIKISNQEIINGLDNSEKPEEGKEDNRHYLFVDRIKLEGNEIKEYQPTIPAHTVGFDVYREYVEEEEFKGIYHNYLPLEFSLKKEDGEEVLSRDKVLPIMPSSFKDESTGKIVEGKVKYNHLTPLVIQSRSIDPDGKSDTKGRNLDRYSAVGQKYNLSINLRDVFGNRTNPDNTDLATLEFTHHYFDKLVPIESWPLIRFSYWFKKTDAKNLIFDIACTCNFLEILDLAGIAKKDAVKKEYKYQLNGGEISDNDVYKLQAVVPGILNNFYTIYAQLNDSKTSASINGVNADAEKEEWKKTVKNLYIKLEELIVKRDDCKYRMPKENVEVPDNYSVEISTAFKLKTPLKIEIGLNRLESSLIHNTDKELLDSNIWDYSLTKEVKTRVTALNFKDNDKSKLTDLNAAIRGKDKKYCLGISSEITPDNENKGTKSEKVIFLINEDKLSSIQAKVNADKSFADSSYFGIKPISNSLWSGDYKPVSDSLAEQSFSNIDLDKSLRVVLENIDKFLQANSLSNEIYDENKKKEERDLIKNIYNQLLMGKRSIVKNKLISQLAGVMTQIEMPSNSNQQNEFRDLLLNNLTNFYAYDGMIKTEVTGLEGLEDHRFSISLKEPIVPINPVESKKSQNYNLVSSKIGDYKNSDTKDEWYILFDQKENVKGNINFDFEAEITHIEYDIKPVLYSEDIKQSTWIQLITPISITDKLTNKKYSVIDWQKITRVFPNKPIITKHESIQKYLDGNEKIKVWNEDEIGLWNYNLDIKDSDYVVNDIIHVDLEIKTAAVNSFADEQPNFEGFIAYWGVEFSKPTIDTKFTSFIDLLEKFVNDLSNQFNGTTAFAESRPEEMLKWFKLYKVEKLEADNKPLKDVHGKSILHWKIVIDPSSTLNVKSIDGKDFTDIPSIVVGPFNMLVPTNRVLSVLPKVKVYRNKGLYEKFVYETDTVRPESATTPHLQYHLPIGIKVGDKMSPIFNLISGLKLPYKSTAKLLINTDDLDVNPKAMLPVIPVRQMEFIAEGKPDITIKDSDGKDKKITIDEMFDKYSNGYPSISLTIYDDNSGSGLPIFNASNIYKKKQQKL